MLYFHFARNKQVSLSLSYVHINGNMRRTSRLCLCLHVMYVCVCVSLFLLSSFAVLFAFSIVYVSLYLPYIFGLCVLHKFVEYANNFDRNICMRFFNKVCYVNIICSFIFAYSISLSLIIFVHKLFGFSCNIRARSGAKEKHKSNHILWQ